MTGRPLWSGLLVAVGTATVLICTGLPAWSFFAGGGDGMAMMTTRDTVMMLLIPVGVAAAVVGAGLSRREPPTDEAVGRWRAAPRRRLAALIVLGVAMIVDISKTSSLGFVIPGMRAEYGISRGEASLLPVAALIGASTASLLWGWATDHVGTRTMLFLGGLGFTGTAVCGAMPSFGWNLLMCGLMGSTAGGLVPVVFSLTANLVDRSRVAAVGAAIAGVSAAGGYVLASNLADVLIPRYGWRALWLSGAGTGVLLLALCPLVPNWAVTVRERADRPAAVDLRTAGRARRASLSGFGLTAGFLSLGYVTWLPTLLRSAGLSGDQGTRLLSTQAWLALPVVLVLAVAMTRWHYGTCVALLGLAAAVVIPLSALALALKWSGPPLTLSLGAVVLLANTMIAASLSVTFVWYDGTAGASGPGVIAGASKFGGLVGQPVMGAVGGAPVLLVAMAVAVAGGTLAAGTAVRRTTAFPYEPALALEPG
ncbi:MAG: MFS transporter [Mycobacteriales bacterium]